MNKNDFCVIMAGGIGTRFWPMSKTAHPKQFIDILGTGQSLIQQTYERFTKIVPKENIFIVTNASYKSLVESQLPELSENQIVLEPTRRNTAPCIAYAAYKIAAINKNANMVVAPSDHIILKEDEFARTIKNALDISRQNNWLLTLGIKPNRPDTGYGYIQYNETIIDNKHKTLRKVKTFTEKPNLEIAKSFLKSGDFLWNSGIFIWPLKTIISAFDQHLPEINELFVPKSKVYNTPKEAAFIEKTYTVCRSISIDYGVMEKADNVYVLISNFGWSDLGTWGSLYENMNKNNDGNAIVGKHVMAYDSKNCIINLPKDKLAVIHGLDNYIVVDTEKILLICKKTDEQQIRNFVNDVKIEKGDQFV